MVGVLLFGLNIAEIRAQPKPAAHPTFEVASIRPHAPSQDTPQMLMTNEHGRLTYIGVTVRTLVRKAYNRKIYPLSNGPDPLSTDKYDIIAKGYEDASEEQTMLMLQALLAERFKLVVHREMKELIVYKMVIGKNGAKFHELTDGGDGGEIASGGGHQIRARQMSMKLLAGNLQGYVGGAVIDATGLNGLYDIRLDFSDESTPDGGPTLFEALQQQLGLKLEAGKGPVEVVVIDHVEKPSEN